MGRVTTQSINTHVESSKEYLPYSYLCGNTEARRYKTVTDTFVYRELESMNYQHPGVLPITHNLLELFSEVITDCDASLVDLILTDAITEWTQRIHSEGCTSAYKAFCRTILQSLPIIFELRISGKKANYPYSNVVWNPLQEGMVSWLFHNKVFNLKIERVKNDSAFSRRELGLLLASQVFERDDLIQFGLGDIHSQELIEEIKAKRFVKASSEIRISKKEGQPT